jgi:hypothetical protein
LNSDTTVYARQDKAFTFSADESPVLFWKPQSGSHGYPARNLDITLCQFRVLMDHFLGQAKQCVNSLKGNLFIGSHRSLSISV